MKHHPCPSERGRDILEEKRKQHEKRNQEREKDEIVNKKC